MSDAIEQFSAAIAAAGLEAPDTIHDGGKLQRFNGTGKRGGTRNSWYTFHGDGVPAGAFGDWGLQLTQTWCAKSDKAMTEAEREAHRARIRAMQAQRDAEQAQRHQQASDTAAALWQAATPAKDHDYLTRKGIKPHGVRFDGHSLVIPMRDTAGTLHSLQTIAPDGCKRFLPGGKVKGCYHAIGKIINNTMIVAEGYATGATIHEATGHAVAVAFNSGNLLSVAKALHSKFPALTTIIAADDDHRTEGNPGLTAAKQAALAVGGFVAVPRFPADRPYKATDFNDLHALAGLAAVRECFAEIEEVAC